MNIIILLCIIALGMIVLRTIIGAFTIIFVGKAAGINKPVGPVMRVWNTIEAAGITYAYIILVMHFYS